MNRIGLAFKTFFGVLFNGPLAERVERAISAPALPEGNRAGEPTPQAAVPPKPAPAPKRSEAITLLAALQREARLIDLVQEPLDAYSDEQIGAAARSVLKDSRATLERFFALQPVLPQQEGEAVELPASYDPARFQVTGANAGGDNRRGRLVHPGWEAKACNLPAWTGGKEAALVVSAAVVEVS
jgi:hypothetical protein